MEQKRTMKAKGFCNKENKDGVEIEIQYGGQTLNDEELIFRKQAVKCKYCDPNILGNDCILNCSIIKDQPNELR